MKQLLQLTLNQHINSSVRFSFCPIPNYQHDWILCEKLYFYSLVELTLL